MFCTRNEEHIVFGKKREWKEKKKVIKSMRVFLL